MEQSIIPLIKLNTERSAMILNYKNYATHRIANGLPLDDAWLVRWSLLHSVPGAAIGTLMTPLATAPFAWALRGNGDSFWQILAQQAIKFYTSPVLLPAVIVLSISTATVLSLSHFARWRTRFLIDNARCLGCSYPLPEDASRRCSECGIFNPTGCNHH